MASKNDKNAQRGKLRIGDDWNAIRIIALSQGNPLKAIAEFVDTVLERTPQPLVAYLAERETLDDEDVRLLREILARHRPEDAGDD